MEAVDCDVMNDSRDRRRRGEMGLSLPPPSVFTAVPAAEFEQMTPRSMLSRWLLSIQKPISGGGGSGVVGCRVRFPGYRSKKRKEGKREGGEVVGPPLVDTTAVQAAGGGLVAPPLLSASVETVPEEQSVSSGIKAGELSLNLGLGVGLIFLLTKSANELNKMIELQKQMALILKDIKDEMQRKKVPPSFTESNCHFVYSDSNYGMNENTSNSTISQQQHHLVGEHGAMESDRQSKYERTKKKKPSVKMNQLEEELEVELERLQHIVEGETSYVLPQPHRPEYFGENSDPSETYDISFVEANEAKEEESSRYGVSPQELERRLHELLESQQQQRIEELESALEYAERKIRERELEICWWKDTAKLVSKHKEEAHFR